MKWGTLVFVKVSNIWESPSRFENRIMTRVYIMSITRSSTRKLHFASGNWFMPYGKIVSVACGFSSIKIDYSNQKNK